MGAGPSSIVADRCRRGRSNDHHTDDPSRCPRRPRACRGARRRDLRRPPDARPSRSPPRRGQRPSGAVDGDAIVHDGVVMVPYQGLFAPLGIRAAWDPTARVLTLRSPAGDELELRPDDPYATVNGERRPIPIPLVTVLGRVLIPAQWVFETLGDVTSYDPATRTLTV